MKTGCWQRLQDELAQAWNVAIKDVRVYYLTPPMIMFGMMMPFFMFFSFSIRREMAAAQSIARLLALTTFFTASSAGPVIIPLERRIGTYDRLLAAPMSLASLLLGKTLVGAVFAIAVSVVPLLVGLLGLQVSLANVGMLLVGIVIASFAFSAFGLVFASIPTQSVGNIMMPSTLVRWPLMFISGVFIPLGEMAPWARGLATDLCPGPDEPRCAGSGPARPVAGPDRACSEWWPVPGAICVDAPTGSKAGLLMVQRSRRQRSSYAGWERVARPDHNVATSWRTGA
jgi:ABC-2 type transport system permease protein